MKKKRHTVKQPYVFQAARPTQTYNINAVVKEMKPETLLEDVDNAIRIR